MGKNNLNPDMPDLETPRIPSMHYDLRNQRIAPHCEICDEPTLTTFNLSDGMGAGDPCCPHCWADLWNIDDLTVDEQTNFIEIKIHFRPDAHDKLAHELGLEKYGINHTLDCGCILTDLTNGKKYITPCDTHQMFTELKIVLGGA